MSDDDATPKPQPPAPPSKALAKAESCSAATSTTSSTPAASEDVVLLGPPTADGAGVHVLRAREQRLEAGELRNLEEGRPITGEIVTLAPRKDNPRVCDVKESYNPSSHGALPAKAKGPAQVATQAYRDNWDEVFARGPRPPRDAMN